MKTKMVKNEKVMNLLTKTKLKRKMMITRMKLKRENWKQLKTKMKMPKQQNLSLTECASIQYGAYGCYSHTALNPWLMVDGIWADHQHVFVNRFDILWLLMFTLVGLCAILLKTKKKKTAKLKRN